MNIRAAAAAQELVEALGEPDVFVTLEGTIAIMVGLTDRGRTWLDENLDPDGLRWAGDGRVVEHRYVSDIVNGALDAGLRVAGN